MQRKKPLVTIYTINKDYGKYIDQCINSVINQTYKNIEYLIIDDGSTDNSIEKIKKYRKKRGVKIFFQKNIGLVKSINKAIKVSKGDYIIRLDSDDYLDKNAIKILLNNIFKFKAAIVFPDYYLVDENGNLINRIKRHNFNKNVTLFNQPAHGACTLYKKSVFEEVGLYSKKYDCQDGVYMWMKVINKYKISNVNKPLFYYRQHSKSLTKNFQKIFDTKKSIYEEINKKNKKKNICFFPLRTLDEISFNKNKSLKFLILKIQKLKKLKKFSKIIISSSDDHINNYFIKRKIRDVIFIKRDDYFSNYGSRLSELLFDTIKKNKRIFDRFDNITIFTLNNEEISNINLMINNLDVFKLNSVIMVKTINSLLFKHDGKGLKPIINYKSGLTIERDTIYSKINGIMITNKKTFLKQRSIIHGKVGHIIID